MKRHKMHLGVLAIAAMASLLFVPVASATVVGTLNANNCFNGGVEVVGSLIDFFLPHNLPPAAPGNGCFVANSGLFFGPTGSTPFPGDPAGTILDLNAGGGVVPGFMVFNALGVTLTFDLAAIGPGVSNTLCAAPPCAIVSGSRFILTASTNGTTITLDANGFAHDSLSPTQTTFLGSFTTQIPGLTPLQVQTAFLNNPTLPVTVDTVSGTFILAPEVPEPVSMALIGGGLMALALLRRRRRRA